MSASDDDLARGTSSAITRFLFGSVRQRLMSDIVGSADFRIRALEFDPQTRVVQVPGRRTVLDARSSRVLEALSNSFGDCVAKDDLMRAGWPTQLVHENSLAKAISKLRRAIDGSGVEIAAVYNRTRDKAERLDHEQRYRELRVNQLQARITSMSMSQCSNRHLCTHEVCE